MMRKLRDSIDTPVRGPMLRAIGRLTIELGRPPTLKEVRAAIGDKRAHSGHFLISVRAARRGGHIRNHGKLELTVRAATRLGFPQVVYVAWAMPGGDHVTRPEWDAAIRRGLGYAETLAAWYPGMMPVSPFFTATVGAPIAAGVMLSTRCHGVVCVRDPLLAERPDVAAARRAGIPITVIDRVGGNAEPIPDPWLAPYVLPTELRVP